VPTGNTAVLSEKADAGSFETESASGEIMLAHGLDGVVAVTRL